MKLITRYIVSSFLMLFAAALITITFVLSLGVLIKATNLVSQGIAVRPIVTLLITGIPNVLVLAIPIATLISALLLFGRLSSDGEISAMKACGINLFQVATGPVIAATGLSLICLYIFNDLAPRAHLAQRQTLTAMGSLSPMEMIEEGHFMRDFVDDVTLYVGQKTDTGLENIRIFDRRDPGLVREIHARHGAITTTNQTDMLLILEDVTLTPFAADRPDSAHVQRWPMLLANAMRERKYTPKENDFTLNELLQRLRNPANFYTPTERKPLEVIRMTMAVELNRRLCLSFSCVAFVLLAIPLGIKAHRRESSIGIALSLLLVFNFYVFVIVAESLVKYPATRPDLIIWMPIIISVTLGPLLLRRAN